MPVLPNSLEARDIASLVHPYTNLAKHAENGPLGIDRGDGIHVWDTDGKQYIEVVAGLWCASLGYGEKELVKAATAQMEKLAFSHLFQSRSHGPVIELAEKLKSLAPCDTARVFFVGDGSSANDTAIKLVWYYNNAIGRPEKKKIIGRLKAYHGVTVASASVTGLTHNHLDWDLPLKGFLHTDCPHYYREALPGETEDQFVDRIIGNLDRLINKVGPETVAAFFAEPIQGAGGLIVPPQNYFPKLQAVLKKYDILLVADEVITGFLRTGNYWGCQTVDMQPDMVTCAKALSSAYLPIGAVTIPSFMHDAMVEHPDWFVRWHHAPNNNGSICVVPPEAQTGRPEDNCSWPISAAAYDWSNSLVRDFFLNQVVKPVMKAGDGVWLDGDGPDNGAYQCSGSYDFGKLPAPYPALDEPEIDAFCVGENLVQEAAHDFLFANGGMDGQACWTFVGADELPQAADSPAACAAKLLRLDALVGKNNTPVGVAMDRCGGGVSDDIAKQAVASFMLVRDK